MEKDKRRIHTKERGRGSGHTGGFMKWIVLSAMAWILTCFLYPDICYAEEAESYNACGIVNRPLSVDPTGLSEGFSAVLYDNSKGLPTSEANAIAQTSEGFIWIGSYAGLIRYDGNNFERMDSTGGLTSIKCLYVDRQDRLWIGTNDNGVAVMEHGNLRFWGKLEGMKSAHTRAITEDENGTIYVATTCGITTIDSDFNLSSMEDEAIAEADMRDLRLGSDGLIYGTTDGGDFLTIRNGELLDYVSIEDSGIEGIGGMLPDPKKPGKVYLEGADFCFYYADINDGFKLERKINIEPLTYIKQIEYIDGKLWICAGNGIGVLEEGDKFTLMENLPMTNNVGHVMTDYLGNLWFTSTRQGVMKVVPNQFSDLSERYNLPEVVVNSTSKCEDKLFLATDIGLEVVDENGLLPELPLNKAVKLPGNEQSSDDLIELLKGCRIRSVIRDSKDRIWISTWRKYGLLRYDHGDLKAFSEEDGLLSNNVRTVREREDGSFLVAVTGGVNVIQDDRIIASYGKEDGIENTESLTVEEGNNGDIIIGSNGGGIYIVSESGVRNINVEDGLSSDTLMRIKKDTKRDLYWIIAGNGIAYMDADYNVTTVRKFPYPNNFDFFENSKGDIWVLGGEGIYVAKAEELLANGELNPVFYGIANGLPCIATANSYSDLTPEGDLYIAGSTGICKVNIEVPFEDVNDLKAAVPYVKADETVIYPDRSGVITVPAETHKLTVFGYVYNYSLTNPLVSYRLKGFDSKSTTVRRSEMLPLDYTNLKGGKYDFVMNLKDSMGRENKEVTVRIVKIKAFYEELWFLLAVGLLALVLLIFIIRIFFNRRVKVLEGKQQEVREQFEQTAEALASAIDAKDRYTNGHSRRVAEYSEMIAREAGKSDEECEKIYFTALLHDVGKIGVPIDILSKKGRLTDEEFEKIKEHPVIGGQILSSIRKSPWLSIGARYHHERYNGRGYPEGLKGEDIPEIARIIAVADSYDAMTSNRSYRNAIPQHIVREELVKGMGTQFDPEFAKIMVHMVDLDTEYKMQESGGGANLLPTTNLRCDSIYHSCSDGIPVTEKVTRISLFSRPDQGFAREESLPTLIVYDALDGRVHPEGPGDKEPVYFEYGQIRLDGNVIEKNIRKIKTSALDKDSMPIPVREDDPSGDQRYIIEAVRYRDHMMVRISDGEEARQIVLALPDTSRFAYISISGENCYIHNILAEKSDQEINVGDIPRIADEISFIKDCPEGDLPNIQADRPKADAVEGIHINGVMTLSFHTMSLPTARLVWHCPYISIFSSSNGRTDGDDFHEYLLLRLNGEDWSSTDRVVNRVKIDKNENFEGWDAWKKKNKQGLDCRVKLRQDRNRVRIETENLGIAIESVTTILDKRRDYYIAITGDQCAITDIHVEQEN
ncbi:MAG: HD domain-containing protein [Lachnospiraceae bacterium]|nr:HD domain-containing protein [Lachnospiraceae bacterium]